MIIGSALGKLLQDFTIDINGSSVSVKYDYGNQDALDKFIAEMDKKSVRKFPLIFYVVNRVEDFNGWKHSNTDIIIMTNTNPDWLSKKRTIERYDNIIEPIYQKLRLTIDRSSTIIFDNEGLEQMPYVDIPNYGMITGGVGGSTSKSSVVTDYVDARKVSVNIRVGQECK